MVTEHDAARPSLRRRGAPSWRALSVVAIAALGSAFLVDAHFIEPARLVVKREELHLPRLPPELVGLKVVLVSDLHVGSPHWGMPSLRALIARINAEHPDLILLAGDYLIDDIPFGSRIEARLVAKELGALRAPSGVIGVLGNHDGWHGVPGLREELEAGGIQLLDDQVARVEARGIGLVVLGLADEEVRRRSPSQELDLAPAGVPMLALVHEPDIFAELDERPLLTLAGHTHGGQVQLPLIGAPIVRSRYGQRYLGGHIVEHGRHLYVTTGVGTSVWPIRFGVPPEYVVLTLR